MSEIREMIRELCPDGVEFMVLGEICTIKTGKGITQKECEDDAPYPVMSGGQSPMGMYYDYNREGDTVTVMSWQTGASYEAEITEISPYPSSDTFQGFYGSNASASAYPFMACISDETAQINQKDTIQITIHREKSTDESKCYMW